MNKCINCGQESIKPLCGDCIDQASLEVNKVVKEKGEVSTRQVEDLVKLIFSTPDKD